MSSIVRPSFLTQLCKTPLQQRRTNQEYFQHNLLSHRVPQHQSMAVFVTTVVFFLRHLCRVDLALLTEAGWRVLQSSPRRRHSANKLLRYRVIYLWTERNCVRPMQQVGKELSYNSSSACEHSRQGIPRAARSRITFASNCGLVSNMVSASWIAFVFTESCAP